MYYIVYYCYMYYTTLLTSATEVWFSLMFVCMFICFVCLDVSRIIQKLKKPDFDRSQVTEGPCSKIDLINLRVQDCFLSIFNIVV